MGDYVGQFMQAVNYGGQSYSVPNVQTTYPGSKQEAIGPQFRSLAPLAFKSNPVVFACEVARMTLFAEARFQFQQLRSGGPGKLFGTDALSLLETPWPGGTTGDLLTRMLLYADIGGSAPVVNRGDHVAVLRPDWTTLILGSNSDPDVTAWDVDAQILGFAYQEGGRDTEPEFFLADEVAYFAPIPDPEARYRGMSWMTPVIREIMADKATTDHKLAYMENGATPNLVVKLDTPDLEKWRAWVDLFRSEHEGAANAYRTMFLSSAADATVIGTNLKDLEFKDTQGAGETRIAAAAGTPPVIVGLSEGLAAATYSNYGQARRRFADGTMWPLWRNAAGSLARIVKVPAQSRLWIDASGIPFLREDEKDAAEIQHTQAQSIRTLIDSGWEAESVKDAITSGDLSRLVHSGMFSVQLQPAGTDPAAAKEAAKPALPAVSGNGNQQQGRELLIALLERMVEAKIAQRDPMLMPPLHLSVAPPSVHLNVAAPQFHMDPHFTVEPARIEAGAVVVHSPDVHVAPADIRVEPQITIEPARIEPGAVVVHSPDVHVAPAEVHVDPQITVEPARIEAGAIVVSPAEVHIAPAEVRVEPQITVLPSEIAEGAVQVHVDPPDVRVDVAPAEIHVDPQITVEPARIDEGAVQVHVEAAPAPDVRVDVAPAEIRVEPQITVQPTEIKEGAVQVNFESPDVNVTVERGGKRRITYSDGRSATVTDGDVRHVEFDDGRTARIEELPE